MNTVENYSTIHLRSNQIELDRCVGNCNALNDLPNTLFDPNKTEDLNIHGFSMITGMNESKTLTKQNHANVNGSLMVENAIKSQWNLMDKWIIQCINVAVSVKNIKYVKNIIILLHVAEKMINIQKVLLMIH